MGVFDFIFGGSGDPSVELSPLEFQKRLQAMPAPQGVDVRSPEENREGKISGSKNIPLGELAGRLGELDRSRPVLLYCRGGNRSAVALRLLRSQGFSQAAHLAGGILAWGRAGFPIERG